MKVGPFNSPHPKKFSLLLSHRGSFTFRFRGAMAVGSGEEVVSRPEVPRAGVGFLGRTQPKLNLEHPKNLASGDCND